VKYRLLYILLLCLFISGCSSKNYLISKLTRLSIVQTQSQTIVDDLKIINSKAIVNHGEFGFITIQGRSETKYKITTSFKRRNRVVSVTQWRLTGIDGQATFNWFVDSETVPGTYSATISGGGNRLNTYHTVNP
jgi:hypothetical protein